MEMRIICPDGTLISAVCIRPVKVFPKNIEVASSSISVFVEYPTVERRNEVLMEMQEWFIQGVTNLVDGYAYKGDQVVWYRMPTE
jgi:hypothetical protein